VQREAVQIRAFGCAHFLYAHICILYGRADEPMARGNIYLARGIYCCPFPPPDIPLCIASETFLRHLSLFSVTTNTHFTKTFITQQLILTLNSGNEHGHDTRI
jgi:hypothetical protein